MSDELTPEELERVIARSMARSAAEFERIERHTDYIDDEQEVFCWLFDLSAGDDLYHNVTAALLRGLRALSESANKRLRARSFVVATGDNGYRYYFVAITRPTADLTRFLSRHLTPVAGFATREYASLVGIPASPRFCYQAGLVGEYSDDSLAGTWRDDDEEWYGSGLRIQYRYAQPAFLLTMDLAPLFADSGNADSEDTGPAVEWDDE